MFNIEFALNGLPIILTAVPRTLAVAAFCLFFGFCLGTILALFKIYRVPFLKQLASFYISFMRGTPLVVTLFIAYYGIPHLLDELVLKTGWAINTKEINPIYYVLTAFTLNSAAYEAETIRSAFLAVEYGQIEAARSVGMTQWQTMRRIILPQALRIMLPSLCNLFLSLIKGLSLAFMVTFVDILAQAKIIAYNGFRYLESYTDAALVYWLLCIIISKIFAKLERYFSRGTTRGTSN